MVEQTVETLVIWDAISLLWRHCNALYTVNFSNLLKINMP